MPSFTFTNPDGQKYTVNGPDGATSEQAFGMLQQHLGTGGSKSESPGMVNGIMRGVANGVPVIGGLLNKAEAATNAAIAPVLNPLFPEKDQLKGDYAERYQQSLRTQEGMDKGFHEEHPYVDTGANIAGAIASTGGAATTGLGAKALGLTAKTIPGAIGAGAASGAAIGGLDAATRGENPVTGAGLGLALGAAGPVVAEGVKAVASPFVRAGRAAITPEIEAAQQVTNALEKDAGKGLSRSDLYKAAMNDQPVALMDVGGGKATQRLARRAANVSPEAQEVLNSTIFGRFRDQNTRTAEFVKGLSEFGDAHELDKALTESARETNAPAYRKAYAAGGNGLWTEGLEQMTQAPVVQDAIRKTMVSAKNEAAKMGLTPPGNPFRFDENGRLILAPNKDGTKSLPSLQFWDYVKRNLDKSGRDGEEWSRILRDHLDDLVPEYKTARAGAAKFFGAKDALQAGREAVTPGTKASSADNRVLRDAFNKLSASEKKLFRDGMVDQLAQTLLGKPDSSSILNQINNTPKAKERLLTVLGPEKYGKLEAYLHVEAMMDRFRTSMGNSTTAQQLGDMAEGSVVPKIHTSLAGMVTDFLTKATEKLGRGIDERVAKHIGTMLASGDGAEYQKALRMISSNQKIMRALRTPRGSAVPLTIRGAGAGMQDAGSGAQ